MKLKTNMLLITTALALCSWSSHAADVEENWTKNCVSCHGKDGKGDTKAGKKAAVKDFTDAKYQASLTEDKMAKQIKEGMKENGKEKMKPYGDKLSEAEIKALVKHVRDFKK